MCVFAGVRLLDPNLIYSRLMFTHTRNAIWQLVRRRSQTTGRSFHNKGAAVFVVAGRV